MMAQSILTQYLVWRFVDQPQGILKAWRNFLKFNLNYWSIFLLIRTLFSPWRRYKWAYPRGFDLGKYAEVFISNLISRLLGAVMRIFLILIGLLIEIFILIGGIIIFLGWLLLPILLIGGIYYGFKILL